MKFSVCNEMFCGLSIGEQAKLLRKMGFDGMELSPFCLSEEDGSIRKGVTDEIRKALDGEGLGFAGIHWLLSYPGLWSLTSSDRNERSLAVDQMKRLADTADELGGGNLVLGSPKQRSAVGDVTVGEALVYMRDALEEMEEHLERNSLSTLCMEPLTKSQTNVCNSIREASVLTAGLGKRVITMLDFHNTADETESVPALIDEFIPIIGHVHANSMDGHAPLKDEFSREVKEALGRNGYSGWVSLEVFGKVDYMKEVTQFQDWMKDFSK